MSSTSPNIPSPKKNTANRSRKNSPNKHQKSSCLNGGALSGTNLNGTEELSSNQRNQQHSERRRHYANRTSPRLHPLPVPAERWLGHSGADGYAGPDFMSDVPSPSTLPIPRNLRSITAKQQQQHRDDSKPYLKDPISEVQEKLRMILKI